jgi:class 3 adenylate cyclase
MVDVPSSLMPDALPEDRLKQALLAHVRQDFSAPVAAIVGYAEILIEDAPRHDLERFVPDLAKIHRAGLALQQLIDGLLDPGTAAVSAADEGYDSFRSRLRHDLRTPMNAIKGYGEMLLEDAEAIGAESFVRDLQTILASATSLLARIDALVEFSSGGALAAAEVPDQLGTRLIDMIRPVPDAVSGVRKVGPSQILVVDDHQSNRDLLARRLSREGHAVVTAEDGPSALQLVETASFDLILLDLLMPGMSGYDVLCRLKADPRHFEIPVIVISALDDIASVVRCIRAGAEDYMPKPFDPVLLRARIDASLERKHLRDREKLILEELRSEKAKSELLLLNMLPRAILSRLQEGETVIADRLPEATILFADLVGFTSLAARIPASRIVELLNRLFTAFDHLSTQFGVEKIKTIGDAYMLAGGVLDPRPDHVAAVADMGLAMLESVDHAGRQFGEPLEIRIGINTGPVVAGVIGTQKFIYDIWGETVNTASRLESHGLPGRIAVSGETYRRLHRSHEFEPRGIVNLRGSGPVESWFLQGRK